MALSKINTNSIADDAVTTAKVNPAQTDVTSVGTLSGLTTSGDIDVQGNEIILDADNDTSITADSDDTINFKVGGTDRVTMDVNGDVRIDTGDVFFATAGKGICLGATTNADANTLDDYEEGTWTPTMTNLTLSTAQGQYIKVGKLVTAHFNIVLPSTSTTNTAVISSLPFNTAGVNQYGGGFFSYQNTSYDMLVLYNQGETYCTILNGSSLLTNANLSGKQFLGTIVYYSA